MLSIIKKLQAASLVALAALLVACTPSDGEPVTTLDFAESTQSVTTEAPTEEATAPDLDPGSDTERATEPVTEPETDTETEPREFRVSAYLDDFLAADLATFDASNLKNVTDVILFSSHFDNAGNVTIRPDAITAVQNLRELTKDNPIRIHVNLLGPFSTLSNGTNDEHMDSMAIEYKKAIDSGVLEQNIKNALEQYGFDGVFFDYEFPVRREHKDNWGAFLVSLKEVLGDEYLMGCAISSGSADLPIEAIRAIDRVELMCYDMWEEEDPDTLGMHSPLSVTIDCWKTLRRLGYESSQIDVGMPFYARPTNHGAYWYAYKDYYHLIDENGYYYDESIGLTMSFNNQETIYKKTEWAIEKGLGGVMAWNYQNDVSGDNELSLFRAVSQAKADAGVK
ncbi:MAG: hypothetical protein E7610_07265 [Ruminococcaceae bacterium]|nr:hypothetical protein [Oscillospiraceae bacterium]